MIMMMMMMTMIMADDDDDDDDDGNYEISGAQKSESVFCFVFHLQLEHPFSQISRLLAL